MAFTPKYTMAFRGHIT